MANRNFYNRIFSQNAGLVRLCFSIPIGSTGAVGTLAGQGVNSYIQGVTRLSAGRYRIQLKDNYYAMLGASFRIQSPVTGSAINIADTSVLSTSTVYQIVTVGTSTAANWVTAGLPAGLTPAAGMIFKAAITGGGTGTGTVKAIGYSGINTIELMGSGMLGPNPVTNPGGYIGFQCVGPTATADTAAVATDPANGSSILVELWMNNSSVQ